MNSIIVFSSFLIATLAIQSSKCNAVFGIDSFHLNGQSSNSRSTPQRSHSSRSNNNSKNRDKKLETIGFVEPANQLNPPTYVGQQPIAHQDGSINPGNDMAYYYNNDRNQRQGYPSQSNTYSRSSHRQRSNSLYFCKTAKL